MKRYLPLLIFLLLPSVLLAQPIGEVLLLQGKLKLHGPSGDRYFKEKGATIPIERADEIQTGSDARAKLFLRGKAESIELYSSSYLSLAKYRRKESNISLPVGKARFKVNYTTLKTRPLFGLRTANTIIRMKGTEFVVETIGGSTNLLTLEGTLTMANIEAPEIQVDVSKNQASRVSGEAMPSAPVSVPPKIQAAILKAKSGNTKGWEAAGLKDQPKAKKVKKKKKKKSKDKKKHKQETSGEEWDSENSSDG